MTLDLEVYPVPQDFLLACQVSAVDPEQALDGFISSFIDSKQALIGSYLGQQKADKQARIDALKLKGEAFYSSPYVTDAEKQARYAEEALQNQEDIVLAVGLSVERAENSFKQAMLNLEDKAAERLRVAAKERLLAELKAREEEERKVLAILNQEKELADKAVEEGTKLERKRRAEEIKASRRRKKAVQELRKATLSKSLLNHT